MKSHALDYIFPLLHIDSVPTVIEGDYEWDQAKAGQNVSKHGVTFQESILALEDPHALTVADEAHGDREVTFGLTPRGVLVVVTTERRDRTRIISARKATSHEERGYQEDRA